MKKEIPALYGSLVFNDKVMRNKLPKDVYKALKKTIENGTHLELEVANSVAVAMKEWAVENAHRKRGSDHGLFRQGTGERGTGRLQLPLRRTAGHL